MKKKLLGILLAIVLLCSVTVTTAFAVGYLKPTMQVTVQGGVYTIEVSGLTRTQSQQLEKLIGNYLNGDRDDDYEYDYDDSYYEPLAVVYLVRDNKLYHVEDGKETYIDTVCDGEIGVDEYNNVVYINENYYARYIYNTNRYPTSTKNITSSAKNLDKQGNVVIGVDYASGNYTKTTSSFIKDAGNDLPVVIYEQVGTSLRAIKLGEYIRITSSISTRAENPIAVTKGGDLIYVTSSGYVYEIRDVETLTKVKSTTPVRLSVKKVADIEIYGGSATEFIYSNGDTIQIK